MGRLIVKLLWAVGADIAWGIGLKSSVGITLSGAWGFAIPFLISFLPYGSVLNAGLMCFGAYCAYNTSIIEAIAGYFSGQ